MLPTNPQANKRKKERACDGCRRRKTKCDRPWTDQNICTNCMQTRKVCTYIEASKPRGPPKAYVTGLEDRLEALETLLRQIRPDTNFSEELGPPVVRGSWKAHLEPTVTSTSLAQVDTATTSKDAPTSNPLLSSHPRTTHLTFPRPKRSRAYASDYYLPDDDSTTDTSSSSDADEILASSFHGRKKISLLANEPDDTPGESGIRFHKTNSTAGLIEALNKFKDMHISETMNPRSSAPRLPGTSAQSRRPQFWVSPPWELLYQTDSPALLPNILSYFPPTDLAESLFSLYFAKSNSIFPLLHRPTFDRQWRDELHHRNIWFACVCICIFAVASRWCDDERVLPEGSKQENGELDWRKAGRQYFEVGVEIHRTRKSILQPASLFELQTFALLSMYLRGTDASPVAWMFVSVGIRKAQDAGAHSKHIYHAGPNADDELWKRAFWHLVIFDRVGGATLGRACGIAEEDFDLDLPLEVDDEYWEEHQDTEKKFEQPPCTPSRIAAFNHFIKLTQIMAFTMRTMYAIDKSKISIIPTDRENLVRQLSSALEEWLNTIPAHLKWSDSMNNPELSIQSTTLFLSYYLVLMLIHRPMITPSVFTRSRKPHSSKPSPPMLSDANPAILICTNATRSCARIIESQLRDGLNNSYVPIVFNAAHICAGLLSYRIWNLKVQEKSQPCECPEDVQSTIAQTIQGHMADTRIFMRALEQAKVRWDVVDSMLEDLNASLSGSQSRSQDAPDNNNLGPIADDHPPSSTRVGFPMDVQPRPAPRLKHNQHIPDSCSFSGTEHHSASQYQTLPTNESSHDLGANSISSRPCSLSVTALSPYIPDHTHSLRRTSFSNLRARGSHDGHQEYSLSLPVPTGSPFSIGGSMVKYRNTNMDFSDETSSHHQISNYAIQKPLLNIHDKKSHDRLERNCAVRPDRSTTHQGWSDAAVTPPDPAILNMYDPSYDGPSDYPRSQGLYHPPYSS